MVLLVSMELMKILQRTSLHEMIILLTLATEGIPNVVLVIFPEISPDGRGLAYINESW